MDAIYRLVPSGLDVGKNQLDGKPLLPGHIYDWEALRPPVLYNRHFPGEFIQLIRFIDGKRHDRMFRVVGMATIVGKDAVTNEYGEPKLVYMVAPMSLVEQTVFADTGDYQIILEQ